MADDGELVRQAASGDRQAADQLVRRWSARVLAVCRSRVRHMHTAEDLAQETLLRAMRGLSTLAEPERFGPWVCGIARRVCLDWLKDNRREEKSYDYVPVSADLRKTSSDDADHAEQLQREIARLPEEYRETLLLYYTKDCTYQQLAELQGISAATVNMRLTKARKMLRERLTRDVTHDVR